MTQDIPRFLARVMPPFPTDKVAYLNLHYSVPGRITPEFPNPKKFWGGKPCRGLGDLMSGVDYALRRQQCDIYVCMSLQSERAQRYRQDGQTYFTAERSADNVVAIKSFYADIDVKEGAYPDTRAALAALAKFCADANIPRPTAVVMSGSGGFHAHWTVDRALTRDEWQPLAHALSAALRHHGVHCDTQCTVDSARILRLPGTFNHKTTPPTNTQLVMVRDYDIAFDDWRAAMAPYIGMAPPAVTSQVTPAPKAAPTPPLPPTFPTVSPFRGVANTELGAGVEEKPLIQPTLPDLAQACPMIARMLGMGGAGVSQPMWFLTAGLCVNLEDGRSAFHRLSDKHAGYVASETDALFDRAAKSKIERDLGWTGCHQFESAGAPECATCPHRSAGKSPLHFARPAPPAQSVAADVLPERYTRKPDGMIVIRIIADDGTINEVPVSPYPIYTGWLSNNPWTFHFITRSESGRRVTMDVPTEVIFAKDSFNKYMGGRGMFCTEAQYKAMKEFFVSWLQKLQQSKDSVISAAPFGWSVVDGKVEGFTYAGRVWMDNDDRPAANPNPVLAFQYTPKGDLDVWQELAKIVYEQQRPELNAILSVAFAGPLVRFTGFPGLLLNAYSPESGIGKTTAMKVSQAVWGHPVLAMQGLNDTTNSVLGKTGQIRSLPMYWDELKSDQQTRRFVSIVFDLTGGREKTRMNADTTLKMSGTWQTMLVSASNDSILDAMSREVGSTTAGLHRLFEFTVAKPPKVTHDVGAVQRLTGKLEDNYGAAGLIYAKFLGRNHERVANEVAACQDAICREVSIKQEERHWAATIAVLLQGAAYANELGLTRIDEAGLKQFLYRVLSGMRKEVDDSPSDLQNGLSVSTTLAQFLNYSRARNILITNRVWVGRGKPAKGAITVLNDASRLGEIFVQIGREDKIIRISSVAFGAWIAERGLSRHTLVKKLEQDFGMTKVNGRLGSGTDLACATEHILELDANDPRLAQFVEV